MEARAEMISGLLLQIPDLQVISPLKASKGIITGKIKLTVEQTELEFTVQILEQYPAQLKEHETIRFLNSDLLPINHVNYDGSICLHSHFSPSLQDKLNLDIDALRQWVKRYVIDKAKDAHYEHIVASDAILDEGKAAMLFTDLDYDFKDGEFGEISYTNLQKAKAGDYSMDTFVLQSLRIAGKEIECTWNSFTKTGERFHGIFVFLKEPPVTHGRFAIEDWEQLLPFLSQDFIDFLSEKEIALRAAQYKYLQLLMGYRIPDGTIHWQMVSIEKKAYPVKRVRIGNSRQYFTQLKQQQVYYRSTRNCSYRYFFGRGALSTALTDKKNLIIGVGALGSMLATALCRGGAKYIGIVDHDVKEPENVCRSEYSFFLGIGNKVDELRKLLFTLSPFIEVAENRIAGDICKADLDKETTQQLKDYFGAFDLVFDCTGDNSLAYNIQDYVAPSQLVNLSISNGAGELVCVSGADSYKWLLHIYAQLGENTVPLYEPTGCWSATFSAGYSDISVLLHAALREINRELAAQGHPRSFYLSSQSNSDTLIKITKF